MHQLFRPGGSSRSRLLVLSGLDGSGKSTQADLLARRMRTAGYDVVTLWSRWEPALSAPLIRLAKKRLSSARDAATSDYTNFTASKRRVMQSAWKRALWQFMVWSEYSVQINCRLLPHRISRRGVICDRYVYDTIIDIAINFSVDPADISGLCRHPLLAFFPPPHRFVCIDIDPEIGSRRKDDGTPPSYLADRRDYYLSMARLLDAPVIDGGQPVDRVAEEIWRHTSDWRLALRRPIRTAPEKGKP